MKVTLLSDIAIVPKLNREIGGYELYAPEGVHLPPGAIDYMNLYISIDNKGRYVGLISSLIECVTVTGIVTDGKPISVDIINHSDQDLTIFGGGVIARLVFLNNYFPPIDIC